MRFLPRHEKFYATLIDQSRVTLEAARKLLDGVKSGNAQLALVAADIRKLEQQGDEIIHDIFTRLNQTFITPIDPEDIHSLSSHLDDVLDGIEEAAHRMVAYQIDPIPPTVVELCEIIHKGAQGLERAFSALEANQPLLEHCIEVNRLEGSADGILRRAVTELFQTEKDPIALIKLKEIYEFLEATTDRCEDVADVLQSVVVKNS
jgi:predicted phosphate transport protein (TIGR00153 family)